MTSLRTTSSQTIRKQMIELLTNGRYGARDLSQELHQSENEIYSHLRHIERTLKASGQQLVIEPSLCLNCGFLFTNRKRLNPPSRCPRCKKTRIRRPRYTVR
ncbi:transcriptional regulator [Desulfobulbus alkaliphilus]|uniref:transcriptional regulator n=1 Tax=Desulfobulbus alkaliphilus TaxID=869814 RepID=UPI001966A173|nr:transcriptional regulator [Desulfobulbus alkaliphilus]MBM9535841.1 transcriptional regulator [Desulfobulbus alkaliphilus]